VSCTIVLCGMVDFTSPLIMQEGSNPYNGTVSFDNIGQSLELVFVLIPTNTFTDLMYYAIDAEFMVAALCTMPIQTSLMCSFHHWVSNDYPVSNALGLSS